MILVEPLRWWWYRSHEAKLRRVGGPPQLTALPALTPQIVAVPTGNTTPMPLYNHVNDVS